MFLLRAAFWVAAVVVLMPREPDLGMPPELGVCETAVADCADAVAWLNEFRAEALSSLARVRADLEAARGG
jgi:hypothetical protein